MFRITYGYYKINAWFKPVGAPFVRCVEGETIKQVNDAFQSVRDNHDLSKYTPINFRYIREIKEHLMLFYFYLCMYTICSIMYENENKIILVKRVDK